MNESLNPATSAKAVVCSAGVALLLIAVVLLCAPARGGAADYTDVKVVSTAGSFLDATALHGEP